MRELRPPDSEAPGSARPVPCPPTSVISPVLRIPTNVTACPEERDRFGCVQAWCLDSNCVSHDDGNFG